MEDRGCGCGNGIAAIIILMVAALIGVGWYQWQRSLEQQTAQAALERQQLRQRQLEMIADDIAEAEQFLEAGQPDRIVTTLRHMDEKLVLLATTANAAGDTEQAHEITMLHNAVTDGLEAIEEVGGDDQKLQVARVQLRDLRKALSRADIGTTSGSQTSPPPGEANTAAE